MPTEVVVLCTLHQFHEEIPGYSYADLNTAIEQLRPDVLAVELTPSDLANRTNAKNKREYQNAVYPLLRHKWRAVPLEPDGGLRETLIADMRGAEEFIEQEYAQKDDTFQSYADTQFSYLRTHWHSAADVNSGWSCGCSC